MKTNLPLLLILLTGCIPIAKDRYVVVGVGIFKAKQTNSISIVEAQTIGVYVGDGRVNVGASYIYSARVPTNANVILEIKK